MSLFHRHHDDPHVDSPEDIFSVQVADGSLTDYRRDDFDQIFSTQDQEEMERQLGVAGCSSTSARSTTRSAPTWTPSSPPSPACTSAAARGCSPAATT